MSPQQGSLAGKGGRGLSCLMAAVDERGAMVSTPPEILR